MLNINGVDVHIEGEGSHAVVMIHGWPDTHRLWDGAVAHLLAQFPGQMRCVRFTLPGFDLAKPAQPMNVQQLVDTFAAIVDAVSPGQPVTLMLHDWGCVFGYEYLAQHPQRVARLIGVDIGDHNSGALGRSLSVKQKLMVVGYQWWLALAWKLGPLSGALANRMSRFMARGMRWRNDPMQLGWQMNYPYWVQWTDGNARKLARVEPQCPMLYLYGRRKPFQFQSPQWLEKMAATPGCVVQGFDTGHWVMVQQADAFNACVADWLAKATSSGT